MNIGELEILCIPFGSFSKSTSSAISAATGTAFLEMTRDSYFFRQEPEREVELISIKWWFAIGGIIASVVFISNAYRLKELKIRNS